MPFRGAGVTPTHLADYVAPQLFGEAGRLTR
jgi:hypothetical protein